MRLLLDSHVLLWALGSKQRLSPRVLALLEDDDNTLFVSLASVWELSLKASKGKLVLPGGSVSHLLEQADRLGIATLSITRNHIVRLEGLVVVHKDPFDRMIVAQALEEDIPLLSADPLMPLYGGLVIWR